MNNTPQGMKPFSLEEWKAGAKPICRNGYEPQDLHYFPKSIKYKFAFTNSEGDLVSTDVYGQEYKDDLCTCDDLFLKSEKKEGWVNLYKEENGNPYTYNEVHPNKETALSKKGDYHYITTIKIEWYE